MAAIDGIGRIGGGDPPVIDELVQRLDSEPEPRVRNLVFQALGRIATQNTRATRVLLDRLHREEAFFQITIVRWLGQILSPPSSFDEEMTDELINILEAWLQPIPSTQVECLESGGKRYPLG